MRFAEPEPEPDAELKAEFPVPGSASLPNTGYDISKHRWINI